MSIDEHRMLTNLLDAFDRLHDGMIEVTDLAALIFATSRALHAWPRAEELVAAEKEVRHIAWQQRPEADRSSQALDLVQPLRVHISRELAAAGPKPRHRPGIPAGHRETPPRPRR
ncbi:hypothetical protein Vau01_110140 [Virgisporangium aurantiacum]|uniref:Uncharacterized protein n=1 Tax=Virgisporangium aurantiacum TaxID=175570 RepID=A0A8J3ZIP2_9ACTN|nr:hypothetical protein Vau01_110140 [Virgisporangium aurantiacum]